MSRYRIIIPNVSISIVFLIGQYKNEIVSKLQTIPNFLDKTLIKNLQSLTGLETNADNKSNTAQVWNILDPLQFRNYLKVPKNNIQEGVNKISEVTGTTKCVSCVIITEFKTKTNFRGCAI